MPVGLQAYAAQQRTCAGLDGWASAQAPAVLPDNSAHSSAVWHLAAAHVRQAAVVGLHAKPTKVRRSYITRCRGRCLFCCDGARGKAAWCCSVLVGGGGS